MRFDLSKMSRSELEATVVSQAKLAERFRRGIANIVREIEDEGDRVYFGSTNDADELRELDTLLTDDLNILECPWMHGRDLYAELGKLRASLQETSEQLERLANRALEYVGVTDGTFDPTLECDAEMRLFAESGLAAIARESGQ